MLDVFLSKFNVEVANVATTIGALISAFNIILVSMFFVYENKRRFGISFSWDITVLSDRLSDTFVSKVFLTNLKDNSLVIRECFLARFCLGEWFLVRLYKGGEMLRGGECLEILCEKVSCCSFGGSRIDFFDSFCMRNDVFMVVKTQFGTYRANRMGKIEKIKDPIIGNITTHSMKYNDVVYGVGWVYGASFMCGSERGSALISECGEVNAPGFFMVFMDEAPNSENVRERMESILRQNGCELISLSDLRSPLCRGDVRTLEDIVELPGGLALLDLLERRNATFS